MARKMTDEEIKKYIKGKSITQDTYVAPTGMRSIAKTPPKKEIKVNNQQRIKNAVNTMNLSKNNSKTFETRNEIDRIKNRKKANDTTVNATYSSNVSRTRPQYLQSDGYIDVNRRYGEYFNDDERRNNYKIYKKDNRFYYKDDTGKDTNYYEITPTTGTSLQAVPKTFKSPKNNKEEITALQKLQLDTDTDITPLEKEKFTKTLAEERKKKAEEQNYVKQSGAGIKGTIGEIKHIGRSAKKNLVEPIQNAKENYDYANLTNQLGMEYYKKMTGKKNNTEELERQIRNYQKYDSEAVNDKNMISESIRQMPNQIGAAKAGYSNAGILGAIGALGGGAVGAFTGGGAGAVAGAQAGAKALGGVGYTKGQAEYAYKLESGLEYQALLEMGVPEEIAKKEAKKVGAINAAIESGESILDLITLGKTSALTNKLTENLVKEYGEDAVKNWIANAGKRYLINVGSETGQEVLQEGSSILGERSAAKKAGIERDNSGDAQRLLDTAKSTIGSTLLTGAATNTIESTIGKTMNVVQQEAQIRRAQEIEELNRIADQRIQQLQQEVQQDPTRAQEATQEIEDIENYVQAQTNIIQNQDQTQVQESETTQPNAITQETQNMSQNEQNDYRGSHQIEGAKPINEVNLDEVENKIKEIAGSLTKQDQNDLRKLKRILNSPDETIKIYRASPKNELNNGDWVTTDKSYAKNVADNNGGKVYEYEVKANQLHYPDDIKQLPSLHRLSSFQFTNNVQNETIPATKNENVISEGEKTSGVFSTVAHYYSKQVNDRNYNKVRSDVDSQFTNKALNIASNLGVNVENIQNNVGGYSFDDGKGRVDELSYTYKLKDGTTRENARMFGCLLGDLGHETQESVVVGNYTNSNNENANLEYTLKLKDGSGIIKALKEAGITDYTFNKQTNELQLLLFKEDNGNFNEQKILDQFQKLNQVLGGKISEPTKNYVESELIESEDRQNLYAEWLESNRGTKNRELYSQIEEAYEKVKSFNEKNEKDKPEISSNEIVQEKEGTNDSSFSNENTSQKTTKATQQEQDKKNTSIKEIRKEVEEKTNKKMSKHIETSSKATNTVEDIKNMNYDDIVYDTRTHEASREQALRELEGKDTDTNVNDIHAKFRGTERLTNVDSAKITELMKQTKELADNAAKNGNDSEYNKRMEQFRTLKGDYAVALSESGQFTEYSKVIKELDPETKIDVLEKVVEREKRRGNKKYKDVTVNKELIDKYKKAKTDEERDVIMEEIMDDTARQIKITFVDKLNEFRFLAMLGNIKTHGRNIFGNIGMYSLQTFKDAVAAIGEDVYSKVSKNGLETRTKTLKPATKEVSEYVSDKVDLFMKDQKSKYNESRGMKGDLEDRTKKFSDKNVIGKTLNNYSGINKKGLNFEDKFFSSAMTKQAMKGFLTANGIQTNADIKAHPELVAQALDYALYKGKEATFRQDSTTATAIKSTRDKLYTGSGFSKLGGLAIDASLPFVSTPINIAKNALEYTPVIGFGNINKQLQQAPKNMKANVFIDSISKQFSGAALMAVGVYLASKGLVKGSGDDDKEDKTEASLGNASYSIKLGNSTYDMSWLSPTAIPFFEGVEVYNAFKKAKSGSGLKATDTADLIDTMFGTLNPMTDMSVLQSIERVITSVAYGGNAVKSATSTTFSSYLQQYIPTLFSQFAQIGDSKQRNTNTGSNVFEKTFDQIKYKIPFARNTLPEKLDVWGNANKTANNIPLRMFESLVSPATRKDYKVDKTTKELERLAKETDDTAMLPTVKNKKVRINKEDYEMKGKDYVNFQKTYGKAAKSNLDKLIKSETYKKADDTEKQSMVRKLYDYASYKAKENYAKTKGINFDSGDQTAFAMVDAFNIPYEKYVENKVSGNESATKMIDKLNNAGLSEAQKGAVMNYFDRAYYINENELYDTLENSNLSNKQKELIKAKYEKNITDSERERYKRADNIGVDYDLYTNFRSFVSNTRGESRTGGLSKNKKIINYIQNLPLSAEQKEALWKDYNNNKGYMEYYR